MRVQVFTKLFIPNAFSPNGDGNNDQWILPGISLYPDALVQIYNRWGQKIFETKDYANNPWRGFYQDRLQNDGVYVYIIQLNNAEKEVLKGTVNLVK
jgi:gliding motility-associated-like protein